ncbi:MAG: GvpL/GvpF family gas vesicle protein [Gemmatimonadaceae bacterium]
MSDAIYYVYGITPPELDLTQAPEGLDGEPLGLEAEGALAALVSRLDPAAYSPAAIEARTSDVEWVGPRAVVHDRVLTWASDQGPVAPFPMFSAMFRDATGVRTMLRERADELRGALAVAARGREYGLRIYRDDAALLAAAATLSPRLAELERAAAAATPGQRYLLERKLEGERKTEARRVSEETARAVYESLAAYAVAAQRIPMPGDATERRAALALNAVFLVAPESYTLFRAALGRLATRFEASGFRFEFSGPWPAYHFMEGAGDGR